LLSKAVDDMNYIFLFCVIFINFIFLSSFRLLYRKSLGLTPIGGAMIGCYYFIAIPLTLIGLNMGFSYEFGIEDGWLSVDLYNIDFAYPFFYIFFSLLLVNLAFIFMSIFYENNLSFLHGLKKYQQTCDRVTGTTPAPVPGESERLEE
jgi:hypothetical protein